MRSTDGRRVAVGDLVRLVFRQDPNSRMSQDPEVGLILRTGSLVELFDPADGSRRVHGRHSIAEVVVLSSFAEAVG